MSNFEKVKEFHKAFGHPVGEEPNTLLASRKAFRMRLIDEECMEMYESMRDGDVVNTAKELADILYVVYGTAVEMGIELDEVFDAVHQSNMSKLGEDGKPIYREDGKVLKGPNYSPPNIEEVLYK